jgi:hypothetical protein
LNDAEKYLSRMEAKEKASASAVTTATAAPVTPESGKMEKDMKQGSL